MTRFEFVSQEGLCKQLRDVLEHPVLASAIEIAKQEITPKEPLSQHGDLIQQAAIGGMKYRGAAEFLAVLNLLTIPLKPRTKDTQGEFDQAALDAMVAQGYSLEEAKKAMAEANQFQINP